MWTHEANLYGCKIKACFFKSDGLEKVDDFVKRTFPMIKNKETIKLIYAEEDRKNFRKNKIVAQPDAVLSQSSHLLSLEYKSIQNKKHFANKWTEQIRLKDILQCIINSIQVSSVENKVTVPLLRYTNVLYFVDPSEDLCDLILKNIDSAIAYYDEKHSVSSSQLAGYVENKVKAKYPFETEGSKLGRELHEKMLRK